MKSLLFFGKSPESVNKKINHPGLVVVVLKIQQTTTSNDLPSVEAALQKLNDALVSFETPGLDQAETLGLQVLFKEESCKRGLCMNPKNPRKNKNTV